MALAVDNISDMQKGMDIITQWGDKLKEDRINGIEERRMPAKRGLYFRRRTYTDSEKTSHIPRDHSSSIRDSLLSAY
jgi:hypothetical protein